MNSAFVFEVAKVVGTPSDGLWSQVHTFFPEKGEKKEKRGDLLAVLVLSGVPEGVEAIAAGREVLARLHEEYYGNLQENPFERLKAAVAKVGEENGNLEIVAAVLFGPALYLAILGEGQVVLKRGEKLGRLLRGKEGLEVEAASGYLQENDLLVLGSNHFFKVVGEGVLKAGLQAGSPNEAVETLAPVVLGRKEMAAAAAILALAKKATPWEIGPVAAAEDSFSLPPIPEKKSFSFKACLRKLKRLRLRRKRLVSDEKKESFKSRTGWLKKPIFVRPRSAQKKKRFYFFLVLSLLVLLGASLVLGVREKAAERKRTQARELVREAEEKLNQAKTLVAEQPHEGRVLGEQAQNLTQEALLLSTSEEASFVKEQTEKFLASLGEEVAIKEPRVFMDLGIIADQASGEAFALLGEDLVILDQEKKKLYFLNHTNKSYEILDYPGEEGKGITASGGKVLVWDSQGVYEVQKAQKRTVLQVEDKKQWGEIVGISSYMGHLYLLDRKEDKIWRYLLAGDGYGAAKNWFVGKSPDLSQSLSLAIDGAIWILENQRILKFNLGRQEDFVLNKMPENFEKPAKIFTNEETENLYVLDKGRGKIYLIDKEGNFKAAYSWEGLKLTDDLLAIEASKQLFVLSQTKIYQIDLK